LGSLLAATWDSPPRPDEPGYESFAKAFERYVRARDVRIPKYTDAELRQIANRPKDEYRHRHLLKDAADVKLGQNPDLRLLPFQVGWIEIFVLHPVTQGVDRLMDLIGSPTIGGIISHASWRMKWVWLVSYSTSRIILTSFTGENRPNCNVLGSHCS